MDVRPRFRIARRSALGGPDSINPRDLRRGGFRMGALMCSPIEARKQVCGEHVCGFASACRGAVVAWEHASDFVGSWL